MPFQICKNFCTILNNLFFNQGKLKMCKFPLTGCLQKNCNFFLAKLVQFVSFELCKKTTRGGQIAPPIRNRVKYLLPMPDKIEITDSKLKIKKGFILGFKFNRRLYRQLNDSWLHFIIEKKTTSIILLFLVSTDIF